MPFSEVDLVPPAVAATLIQRVLDATLEEAIAILIQK